MFKLVLLLSLAAVGFSNEIKVGFRSTERLAIPFPTYVQRVVGGQDASEGEYPYQISLQTKSQGRHFCGGSILSEKYILTAGHCVFPRFANSPTQLKIVAGILRLSKASSGQSIGVQKIYTHPRYTGGVKPNDISVLILDSALKFNQNVQPIALPEPQAEFTGDSLLSGWGSTSNTNTPRFPDCLQKVTLPILTHSECASKWGSNSALDKVSNVCTGPVGGSLSACSGDSGGPLAKDVNGKRVVIGIVSWGSIPCGRGYPSVYTKVSSFIDFIKQHWA